MATLQKFLLYSSTMKRINYFIAQTAPLTNTKPESDTKLETERKDCFPHI